MNIETYIMRRRKFLEQVVNNKKKALEHAPDGALRGIRHHKGWQYFHRKSKQDKSGTYIPISQRSFAHALGQKMYDQKILKKAQDELVYISKYEKFYENGSVESVYNSLPESHQKIVDPIIIPDKTYIENWLATPFQKKSFNENTPEYYTENGARVRSKSEVLIANLLIRHNIPYLYEKPLYLQGYGTVHPDFTILDMKNRKEVYYEHFGMMDDREYRDHAFAKITCYEQNNLFPGDRLLISFETLKQPINMKIIDKMLARFASETKADGNIS